MSFAWDTVVGPLIDILKSTTIVEVGAEHGVGSRRLLEFCRKYDGKMHVIDPLSPDQDGARHQAEIFATLLRENPGRLTFHRARSLPLLDEIGPYDAIFIDGDHNWYTVIEELRAVERMALKHGVVPLIAVDDVGWPHGRRDAYFAPETIPAEHRHPSGRGGAIPGSSALVEGGPFGGLIQAEHEGGPRNGVRTAVEDFLRETSLDLACRMIPLRAGSAILLPRDDSPASAPVRHWLDAWSIGETQMSVLWDLSAELLALINTVGPMSSELVALRQRVAEAESGRGAANELWSKVGDGVDQEGGISWGQSKPPLLHRRSYMPCRILTSSNWFSQALSAINSPKSCVVARVACLARRSRLRSRTFSAGMASSRPWMGANASSATAICLSVRC